MEKQLELDFTSPDQKTAQQLGIRWAPEDASPEVMKEWEEEGKWWADNSLNFVIIASLIQFTMLGLMLLSFWGINNLVYG